MAMNVEFYYNYSDNRYVTKNIELAGTVTNAIIYENTSLNAPIIKCAFPNYLNGVNYCHIPYLGRYYYITDTVGLIGGSAEFHLRCDVLMTYGGFIRNSTQTVIRSESIGAPTMIPDEHYTLEPRKNMKVIIFEGGDFNLNEATANSYNFVINVAGGGSGQQ